MYVMYKLKNTYIFKTQRVHKSICMKASGSRMYMYNQQFGQDRHIHEVKHINMKSMHRMGIQVKK